MPLLPVFEFRSPPLTLYSFTNFPKLPTEIRLMVWELVLPGERVIRIEDFTNTSRRHKPCTTCRCIGSRACVPTLLHVNHETRQLALKFYTVTFKNRLLKPTYFNPILDILLFPSVETFFKFAEPVVLTYTLNLLEVCPFTELFPARNVHAKFGTASGRYNDDESIESKLRYSAIGRSNPLPCRATIGATPWEEISSIGLMNLLGGFGNLTKLFIEGVYLEDSGFHPAPPPSADRILKTLLDKRWKTCSDQNVQLPEIIVVGPTSMKQMRFRAREARL
ncbi:hypothetical protein ONS95_006637 [Cadophora gregata]|uniref:uncharacterized protein n=1 Tax=Cadophora gregata TaxID=51156 RepID=UPI0026DB4832|nr:uncharacterized protein ONS95_006637 [Cadophora gregata]KAK0101465.1 hypothetical protein ONS95_006637 [Cadophora gregata]KAK0106526.1 hypothetical protein ONS96_004148 [Cadophora gregata f. sp. sojae]